MRKTSGCALRLFVEARHNLEYGFMCLCCPGPWLGRQSSTIYTGTLFGFNFFSVGSCNISAEWAAIMGKVLEALSVPLHVTLQLKLLLVFFFLLLLFNK